MRTFANGCERERNVERTHPQRPDPQIETGTLATHSGKPKISSKSVKHPSQKVWHEPPADFIDGSAVLEKMVILFQQRVPSIDAT